MEVFTLEEWENNFDALFKRVEEGETIGVVREDGLCLPKANTHNRQQRRVYDDLNLLMKINYVLIFPEANTHNRQQRR